jgi:hypothetical protein
MAPSPWPGSRSAGPQASASRSPSFYYANSKLYDATREAFDAAVPELDREDDFLDAFKRLGCYLEDLSRVPVNHLDLQDREQRRERRALRAEGIKPLARRMKPWSPLVVAPVVLDMVKTGHIVNHASPGNPSRGRACRLAIPGSPPTLLRP